MTDRTQQIAALLDVPPEKVADAMDRLVGAGGLSQDEVVDLDPAEVARLLAGHEVAVDDVSLGWAVAVDDVSLRRAVAVLADVTTDENTHDAHPWIESRGGPRRTRAEQRQLAAKQADRYRPALGALPPSWQRVVEAVTNEIETAKQYGRAPSPGQARHNATLVAGSAKRARRILTISMEIAKLRKRGTLNLRNLLRLSEWSSYSADFMRRIREGLDPGTGQPRVAKPGEKYLPGDPEMFARKWSADPAWLRWLCDTFGEIAARTGTDRAGRLADAIAPLVGDNHRDHLETVWAALVREHVRERNGGRLPFRTESHVVGENLVEGRRVWVVEDRREVVIDDVAHLCGHTFPDCRLRIRPELRSGEVTMFPAMGRRLQNRVKRLRRTIGQDKIRSVYRLTLPLTK